MSTRVWPPTNINGPRAAAGPHLPPTAEEDRDATAWAEAETGRRAASAAEPPAPRPVRVRLPGTLDGAEVEIEAEVTIRQLRKLVDRLREGGFIPRRPPLRYDLTADGVPLCPRHGVPMHAREKQGDTWYSHKVVGPGGEKLYCRGYPGPESPGYAVTTEGTP